MAALQSLLVCIVMVVSITVIPTSAQLSADFYNKVCPQALPAIRAVVKQAIFREPRIGASLLRLHFHDCFVNIDGPRRPHSNNINIVQLYHLSNPSGVKFYHKSLVRGCDGSILLDDTPSFTGEKTALPNVNSVRGFDVIDDIKKAVDEACKRSVVSCADILAVAARDAVFLLDGPLYQVLLGRRDARNASLNDANRNLPPPFFNFPQLLSNFQAHGLDLTDLVVLSAAHTIGLARCTTFRARIYNDTNIDPSFAASAQQNCPSSGGNDNTLPLDATTRRFDTVYFNSLLKRKGLLHSDQELFKNNGTDSDKLVFKYSNNPYAFAKDFSASMIKMGNLKPLTGNDGEVRLNCRKIN